MLNRRDGSFTEIGAGVGLDGIADARAIAFADLDRDGDADLVVNNYKAKAAYYVNTWADRGTWLAVRVSGTRANRDGVGSQVIATIGNRRLVRLVGNHGYSGQSSLEQIFGLDGAAGVDTLEVRWPDGTLEDFGGPHAAGQRLRLVQGSGSPAVAPTAVKKKVRWRGYVLLALGLAVVGRIVERRLAR